MTWINVFPSIPSVSDPLTGLEILILRLDPKLDSDGLSFSTQLRRCIQRGHLQVSHSG